MTGFSQTTKQCTAFTVKGKKCQRSATQGEVCFGHSDNPSIKARRHQIAVLGGSHKEYVPIKKGATINDSRDLHKYLSMLLTSIARGSMQVSSSNLKDITQLAKLFIESETKAVLLNKLEKLEEAKEQ